MPNLIQGDSHAKIPIQKSVFNGPSHRPAPVDVMTKMSAVPSERSLPDRTEKSSPYPPTRFSANHDPTANAEINAIRQAARVLGTHDLSGCVLYTTCYPCPMCMGAVLWANIREIVYGCRPSDADAIGFRDDFMYEFSQKRADSYRSRHDHGEISGRMPAVIRKYKEKNHPLY
jgi:guanine deaminase